MDPIDQIAQIKATATAFTSTAIRGVQGGFVVTGNTQYQDKATKGIVFSENSEGVAASAQQAAQMSLNFHNTGNFDGAQQADPAQPNLFAAAANTGAQQAATI